MAVVGGQEAPEQLGDDCQSPWRLHISGQQDEWTLCGSVNIPGRCVAISVSLIVQPSRDIMGASPITLNLARTANCRPEGLEVRCVCSRLASGEPSNRVSSSDLQIHRAAVVHAELHHVAPLDGQGRS